MKKLSAFVLAAATILTVAGAPMTSHAAVIRIGGNNTNGYMTSCNGQARNRNGVLNQMGFNTYNGQNCGNAQNCGGGFGQCQTGNQGCGLNNSNVRPGMPMVVMPQM